MKHTLLAVIFVGATIIHLPGAVAADRSVEFLNVRKTNLPFSDAVRVGDLLFLSGNIGTVPGKMALAPGGIQGEAKQTLENIKTTLEAHGYAMSDIVKCTVMLADIAEWADFNQVYVTFFSPPYPARSAFATNGLALGAKVELQCIAAIGNKND